MTSFPNQILTGIYAILGPERMVYVGQSCDIYRRWGEHRSSLNLGREKEHSLAMQQDWDYHGEESFEFIILEQCEYITLTDREQWYMNQFERRHLYNRTWAANSRLGVPNRKPLKRRARDGKVIKLPNGLIFKSVRKFTEACGYRSDAAVRKLIAGGYTYSDIARHNGILTDIRFIIPRGGNNECRLKALTLSKELSAQ